MSSDDTDVRMLRAAAQGDPPAWEELYVRYRDRVYGWCRGAGLSREDAQDVSQEVFWAVYKGLESFDHGGHSGSFRAWLHTIAVRRIAFAQRSFARSRLQEAARLGSSRPIRTSNGEDACADLEALAAALECVRPKFSSPTWSAFAAYVIEGRRAEEVAQALGTTRNAVYLARAHVVEAVRAHLAKD